MYENNKPVRNGLPCRPPLVPTAYNNLGGKMKNLSIAHRIMLIIGASILALLGVGLVGLDVSQKETESIHRINDDSLAGIVHLSEARQAFMMVRVSAYPHVLTTDASAKKEAESNIERWRKLIWENLREYEKTIVNEQDKRLLDADTRDISAYFDVLDKRLLPKSRANEHDTERDQILVELATVSAKARETIDEHIAFNRKTADDVAEVASATSQRGKMVSVVAILVAVMAIGALGFLLLSDIRRSLREIQAMATRVEADLDFTVRVDVRRFDEIGLATAALNRLLDKLQHSLKSIAGGAQSVASAADQLATTSHQVATASRQQSEAASDMAATVEEMTVSVNHVADRAQEANTISSKSGQLAIAGEDIIGQTVGDIQDIATTVNEAAQLIGALEQHSQQISNVVAVIKEVADQTNLLALNAAIEAARAGEQGRGFAVVADEVRKLAERTAASTTEIAATIATMHQRAGEAVSSMQAVTQKVTEGVSRAEEANRAIRQIGEESRNAVGMVEEITAAIREQGAATNNIATRVEHIAQMSEESSAAAENSAQSAEELDRLANEMQQVIGAYRL